MHSKIDHKAVAHPGFDQTGALDFVKGVGGEKFIASVDGQNISIILAIFLLKFVRKINHKRRERKKEGNLAFVA